METETLLKAEIATVRCAAWIPPKITPIKEINELQYRIEPPSQTRSMISLARGLSMSAFTAGLFAAFNVANADSTEVLIRGGGVVVTTDDIRSETARAPGESSVKLLQDPNLVARMAQNLFVRRVLAQRAQELGLDQNPGTAEALRLLKDRLLSDALMVRTAAEAVPDPSVLEKLARNEYNAFPEKFVRPEQVKVRHMLLGPPGAPDAERRAQSILSELKAGANFASLARENSIDDKTSTAGGDLGYIQRGKMVRAFEEAAFSLTEPGQLSDVVRTSFGYHIIKLEDRLSAGKQEFSEVRDQIMRKLAEDFGREAITKLSRSIMESAEPNSEAINAFVATNHSPEK